MADLLPDVTLIAAEIATIVQTAKDLVVKDAPSYAAAMTGQGIARHLSHRIKALFAEVKREADSRHARICAAEKRALAPALDADQTLGIKAQNWRREQEANRLGETRRLEAEIRAKQEAERAAAKAKADAERKAEEERKLAEAEKWEREGLTEIGLGILEQPIPAPVAPSIVIPDVQVILPPAVPVVPGASIGESWFAEVDLRELIAGVAAGETSLDLALIVLQANMPECNRLVRSQKRELKIRGITAVSKEKTSHR